jgi:small subunit ribosomal protein S18
MTANNKLVRTIDRSSSKLVFQRNNSSPLSKVESGKITYKNPELLKRFVSEGGRILPKRITNLSAKNQRRVTQSIKRARFLAILPFSHNTSR